MQKLLIYFLIPVGSQLVGKLKGDIHPLILLPIQSLILLVLILLMSIDVLGTILGTKQSHGSYRSICSRRSETGINHTITVVNILIR